MKRHPGRGLTVVALLMLASGAANAGTLALSGDAAPFGWKGREAALANEDPGLTVEDKVTLLVASTAAPISDEDDCTQSTAGGSTAAASGRCTRG